jgi:hypothetical protein
LTDLPCRTLSPRPSESCGKNGTKEEEEVVVVVEAGGTRGGGATTTTATTEGTKRATAGKEASVTSRGFR